MMPKTAAHASIVAITALVCVAAATMVRAENASVWEEELHAAARLIGGATLKSADAPQWLRAGVEIRLDPGWKTYWRYPGDSGVPPTFDFAGSENVKAVTTLWPAPDRFPDGAGGQSIGYRGDVVLPLRIMPMDPAKPSSLHLKLGYAVCGNLCVPAEAKLELMLPGKDSTEEPALAVAEARVPRRIPLGPRAGGGLAVRSVHREAGAVRDRVAVEVVAPEGAPVDLFVEGPTPDWALPLPRPKTSANDGTPNVRQFTFELEGLPPGAQAKGARLILTAVSPTDAIEVEAYLD
jgi:DsbC/DsbD-like thiol-disulfide interchange protein